MKKILVVLLFIGLFGCVTIPANYNFTMTAPSQNSAMQYSDDYIDISFAVGEEYYKGVEGFQQYTQYNGLDFTLNNKTSEVITIDWNKISFIDPEGSAGNAVMHKGIKYNNCSDAKQPTAIPPKGKLIDSIVPCYAVKFLSGRYARWNISMLPSPRTVTEADFGVYMPVKVGDSEHTYEFSFHAVTDQSTIKK